jgi:non-homologous end joining protein Ku
MAPARPYWKGYLKLSLVSCPIALYTGTSSTERISFRQISPYSCCAVHSYLSARGSSTRIKGHDR